MVICPGSDRWLMFPLMACWNVLSPGYLITLCVLFPVWNVVLRCFLIQPAHSHCTAIPTQVLSKQNHRLLGNCQLEVSFPGSHSWQNSHQNKAQQELSGGFLVSSQAATAFWERPPSGWTTWVALAVVPTELGQLPGEVTSCFLDSWGYAPVQQTAVLIV